MDQTGSNGAGLGPYTYKYTGPNNTLETVSVNYSWHTIVSSFGCGIGEYNTSVRLIDSVSLADGTSYRFSYLADGRISQLTLPAGGYIQYSYPGAHNGVDCGHQVTTAITRTTSDGAVHQFTRSVTSSISSTSTYTDLPPAFVHVRIRQTRSVPSPV